MRAALFLSTTLAVLAFRPDFDMPMVAYAIIALILLALDLIELGFRVWTEE